MNDPTHPRPPNEAPAPAFAPAFSEPVEAPAQAPAEAQVVPAPPPPPRPDLLDTRPHAGRGVALMLALAALLAAVIAARASFLSSEASSEWQSALRNELKLGAAMVEDVRFVYNDEAPQAFLVAAARIRAEEYRAAARGAGPQVAPFLRLEADAQELLAESLAESSLDLAKSGQYDTPEGGFDVGRRLADNRARYPDLVALDPDGIQRAGDERAAAAVLMLGATVPVGVAFLFGALAQAYGRRRRTFLRLGYATLALSLILAVVIEVTA